MRSLTHIHRNLESPSERELLGRRLSDRHAHIAPSKRTLHPDPTSRRDVTAKACQHCGADVSQRLQITCEAYDHVEIPAIKPDVTRVTLFGGTCPCCAKKFKAPAPQDMPKGSPFGENLRAFVIYLRFTQGVAFARLSTLLSDLLGIAISEGALINMLDASREAFAAQTNAIRQQLLSGTRLTIRRDGSAGRQEKLVAVGVPPRGQRRLRRKALAGGRGGGLPRRFQARLLGVGSLWRADGLCEEGSSSLSRPSHSRRAICDRRW